ncbi:hypothetical protein [Streptomyces sirii]|uniref:hypothetical protein n=1 Tax=Streptomyces sirii TaxID=3127701 RepID=UPI003D35C613
MPLQTRSLHSRLGSRRFRRHHRSDRRSAPAAEPGSGSAPPPAPQNPGTGHGNENRSANKVRLHDSPHQCARNSGDYCKYGHSDVVVNNNFTGTYDVHVIDDWHGVRPGR